MTDNEAINIHLNNYYNKLDGITYFSGFCGALKDARKMTGRNIKTGKKDCTNRFGHLGSWLGTLGYLSLLDQLGTCFKRKNGPVLDANKSGIIKALKNFTNFQDWEIDSIYALRNSLAHDYSLQNINNRRIEYTQHFQLDNSESGVLVKKATIQWNGNLNERSKENQTYINLRALGTMVENLLVHLRTLLEKDKLLISLPGGKEELLARYSFKTGKKVL